MTTLSSRALRRIDSTLASMEYSVAYDAEGLGISMVREHLAGTDYVREWTIPSRLVHTFIICRRQIVRHQMTQHGGRLILGN
jgi:hypothetical protein